MRQQVYQELARSPAVRNCRRVSCAGEPAALPPLGSAFLERQYYRERRIVCIRVSHALAQVGLR